MQDQTPLFNELAKALMTVCGPEFTKAEIVATVDAGYAEVAYNCESASGRKDGLDSSFDTDRSVTKALHSLRETMPGDAKFSTCTFTLSPDGTFKFDVGYDD